MKKFIVIWYEVHNLGVKDLKEFTNKEDALKYLREEANNMYEICCSYYKKERHLENMDDAERWCMLSFDYLGENTAYISDCDDKVWTWEIIEA